MMRFKLSLLSLLSLFLLAACSQKDPDMVGLSSEECMAPSDLLDADAVEVSESYYPMVDGATWVYRHTGGSEPWDETVMVSAQTGGDYLQTDTPGPSGSTSASVLSLSGTQVLRVSKEESTGGVVQGNVEYDPGFIRFDGAWPSLKVGCKVSLSYNRKEYDGAGQLTRDGERTHEYTVEELGASVTTEAGAFEDCVIVYRGRVRSAGSTASEEDNKRFWFCRGVGKVLEVDEGSGKREALISCDVPGGSCP